MLSIYPKEIDFQQCGVNVVSSAQKFILPIPKLKNGGEPLVHNEGPDKDKPILDWTNKPIEGRGFVFHNYKDDAVQAVRGDGKEVIIFNLVDQEHAKILDQKICSYNTNINELTLDDLKNIMHFAHNELGLGDVYNSDKTFIQHKMKPVSSNTKIEYYGLHIRDDSNVCQAVYIEGEGQFCGPAATPQKFTKGAVIIKQDQDYRLVQPDIFIKTYKNPDYSEILLSNIKVFKPQIHENKNVMKNAFEEYTDPLLIHIIYHEEMPRYISLNLINTVRHNPNNIINFWCDKRAKESLGRMSNGFTNLNIKDTHELLNVQAKNDETAFANIKALYAQIEQSDIQGKEKSLSDLCRLLAIYKYSGLYLDADVTVNAELSKSELFKYSDFSTHFEISKSERAVKVDVDRYDGFAFQEPFDPVLEEVLKELSSDYKGGYLINAAHPGELVRIKDLIRPKLQALLTDDEVEDVIAGEDISNTVLSTLATIDMQAALGSKIIFYEIGYSGHVAAGDANDIDIIGQDDLNIIQENQRRVSDLSSLLEHTQTVDLKPDDQKGAPSCTTSRIKRAANSCLKENENFLYDPLEEQNMSPQQAAAHRHAEVVSLATSWELTKHRKHKKLHKAIKYYRNIGEIINEGKENWSAREHSLLDQHDKYSKRVVGDIKSLLQEIPNDLDSWHNHKVKIYDNGKSSVLVFRATGHFKIYSSNLDYQRLYRTGSVSHDELNAFINAFFVWKDGSSDHKSYTLSKNIPHKTLGQIRRTIYHPKTVQSDYKILIVKKGAHIENVPLDIIHDLFALDDKPIEISQLTKKFFQVNHARLTLRVDKLHEALQYMDSREQIGVFNMIRKYNIDGSWTKGTILDKHTYSAMNQYSKEVIRVIKEQDTIDLSKLSELSWSVFAALIKDNHGIGEELGNKIIENTKDLHSSLSTKNVIKEIGIQGLFFLPSILKAVNTHQYQSLVNTGEMIAGDAAINKLIISLTKYLPTERAVLFNKLPITSPIFKALTIYSIVELHKELNNLPLDAPQRKMIKHELIGQYATIGLMCAEMLGVEAGPAWFVLIGVQLSVEAEDMRAMYKLDVSFTDALALSLGFKKDKLNIIMEEREIVDIDLFSPQASKAGYTITQIPKIKQIIWKDINRDEVPETIRVGLLQKIWDVRVNNNYQRSVESGIYQLTQSYKEAKFPMGVYSSVLHLIPIGVPAEQWQIKKIDFIAQNSMIKFGQYPNNDGEIHHIESNNWFLDEVQNNNHTWNRVPQNLQSYIPNDTPVFDTGDGMLFVPSIKSYKRAGPTAHIIDPVSRTDTGNAALYINQQVVKHNPQNLNKIHCSFDPLRGNLTLEITEPGLANMDATSQAYQRSAGNNVYNATSTPYLFQVIVSNISLSEATEYADIYHNDNRGALAVKSDSMRVITRYVIVHNTPCIIQDSTNMSIIQFMPDQALSQQNKKYFINGHMTHLSIEASNMQTIRYTLLQLNANKKYLVLDLETVLIRDKLELGAETIEIMNVQGSTVDHSILKIIPNAQSFNITLLGNIIVSDNISTLILKNVNSADNAITFTKNKSVNDIPHYIIDNISIKTLLHDMPQFSTYNKLYYDVPDVDANSIIELGMRHMYFSFASNNNIYGGFNTSQSSFVSFIGTIDSNNAVLNSFNTTYILELINQQGDVTIREYTHYTSDNIIVDQYTYITRIFDYSKKFNNIILSHNYIENNSKVTIDTYNAHSIQDEGRVYEFTILGGLTIIHYFPQEYKNITINEIIYTIKNNKLYAIDGQNHQINGDKLLSIGSLNNKKVSICFDQNFKDSTVSCSADNIVINGITLHNVAPEIHIIFGSTMILMGVLINTVTCNMNAYKYEHNSLSLYEVQDTTTQDITSLKRDIREVNVDDIDDIPSLHPDIQEVQLQSAEDNDQNAPSSSASSIIQTNIINNAMLSFKHLVSHTWNGIKGYIETLNANIANMHDTTHVNNTAISAYNIKKPVSIDSEHCVAGAQSGHEYIEGTTCYIGSNKYSRVMIFPIKSLDTCATPISQQDEIYSKASCIPIKFNDQNAVYCEGQKTSIIYTPYVQPNILEHVNDNLMLAQVFVNLGKTMWQWYKSLLQETSSNNLVTITQTKLSAWHDSIAQIQDAIYVISESDDIVILQGDTEFIKYIKDSKIEDLQEDILSLIRAQHVSYELIEAVDTTLSEIQNELYEIQTRYLGDTNNDFDDASQEYKDHDAESNDYLLSKHNAEIANNTNIQINILASHEQNICFPAPIIDACDTSLLGHL